MKKWIGKIGILILLLLVVALICLFLGTVHILPFSKLGQIERTILLEVRFPRILMGIIVGAGLAISGVIFQALLRNPLADPYLLGTSSGAALGITLGIFLGLQGASFSLPLAGFGFALLSLGLVYNIARTNGRLPLHTLLLSGIIVSAFFSALVMLIMSLAKKQTYEAIFWLMGNLTETNFLLIKVVGGYVLVGGIITWCFWRDLNIISLGEEQAQHLGIEVERVRKILFVLASLIVGAVVSVSGMIGFVGLIIPHMVRMIVGPDHRILIPASGLVGATFLMLTDTLARTIASPVEIPVGVITALCGAPFFIWLLIRKK